MDLASIDRTLTNVIARLLQRQARGGWWEGHLSSSALGTATAVSALALAARCEDAIGAGLEWLARHQNPDGGWGDTVVSASNISTTVLCWCSFAITGVTSKYRAALEAAENWLERTAGGTDPQRLTAAILRRYGEDRTFSVPILTVMALAGKLGAGSNAWRAVPQLPFELAALPHQLFRWAGLPVVSYALPALIAIGQVRHHSRPSINPFASTLRRLLEPATLKVLEAIQPASGGYLEATPLTSFVVMSLAASGRQGHPVVENGVRFLLESRRADGSWPIDTNLATWVTTLAVNALACLSEGDHPLDAKQRHAIREWLLDQQHRVEHPYTHAAPGGWAWTPLSGGVPDADDTAGVLLALKNLGPIDDQARRAAVSGLCWLLNLQNRDGGMPTFCRGWGKLPFDRSGADLTAHALAAWQVWLSEAPAPLQSQLHAAIARARRFLARIQNSDGSWSPLWFGDERAAGEENRTYGTARIVGSLAGSHHPMLESALRWLERNQNPDGGWGGGSGAPSTIETTALAVHAIASRRLLKPGYPPKPAVNLDSMLCRGAAWLVSQTGQGTRADPSPIGLYFARLWYFEELYPWIFTAGALSRARMAMRRS